MEVARNGIAAAAGRPFGIVGAIQTAGRGTGGRRWTSPAGNLYFTLAVPQPTEAGGSAKPAVSYIKPDLVPVLPLLCGLACRQAILAELKVPATSAVAAAVSLKWPNDIIYTAKKIGGTLVESEDGYFLIGMGLNVLVAPPTVDGGREATTIQAIAADAGMPCCSPVELANAVWSNFFALATSPTLSRASVVSQFDAVMNRSLKLHKRLPDGRDPEPLEAVGLNTWGHLTVQHQDGATETLSADYLF